MPRFYSKRSPETALLLSNGAWLKFEKVDKDWGVLVTDNPKLIAEFEKATREDRGGITEITSAEYQELKKKQSLPPPKPDEISLSNLHQIAQAQRDPAGVAPAGAVVNPMTGREEFRIGPQVQQDSTFRPKGVSR